MAAPSAANQRAVGIFLSPTGRNSHSCPGQPYTQAVRQGAPATIVSVYRKKGMPASRIMQIDLSIAMENLWLATDAEVLGGVWLGIAP